MSEKVNKDWKKFKEESLQAEEASADEIIDADLEDDNMEGILGIEHPDYAALEDKLTAAEQKVHENWEKATRAVAELENVRRRSEREISNAHKYGIEKFVDSILPVVDSLEQALLLAEKAENASMHEGLELTMKLFLDVLQKHGVVQIDPVGEAFNPELHEAMSMQPDPNATPNSVLVVFQKGYKLFDRVIRAARVVVAK